MPMDGISSQVTQSVMKSAVMGQNSDDSKPNTGIGIGGGTAGAVAVVATASILFSKFNQHQAKKKREEHRHIETLYYRHLAQGAVHHQPISLPPIFKIIEDSSTSFRVEYIGLSPQQVDVMKRTRAEGLDPSLSSYREEVEDALMKIKNYHELRDKKHEKYDLTAGVLSYLLYVLQDKCLHFEGCELDICYLQMLSEFIREYAYAPKNKHQGSNDSVHYSRLQPVYTHLQKALFYLQQYQLKISLRETIIEAREQHRTLARQLMNGFLLCLLPNQSQEPGFLESMINGASMSDIARGMLAPVYVKTRISGWVVNSLSDVQIPSGIYRRWVMALAQYYKEAVDANEAISEEDIKSFFTRPEEIFTYPSLERPKSGPLGKVNQIDTKIWKRQWREIKKLMQNNASFWTRTIVQSKHPHAAIQLKKIEDLQVIYERNRLMSLYAKYTHQVISLLYYCTQLSKVITQLGVLFYKNRAKFIEIMAVFQKLSQHLRETEQQFLSEMTRILTQIEFPMVISYLPNMIKRHMSDYRHYAELLQSRFEKILSETTSAEEVAQAKKMVQLHLKSVSETLVGFYQNLPKDPQKDGEARDPRSEDGEASLDEDDAEASLNPSASGIDALGSQVATTRVLKNSQAYTRFQLVMGELHAKTSDLYVRSFDSEACLKAYRELSDLYHHLDQCSKKYLLTPSERNYSQFKKKALSALEAVSSEIDTIRGYKQLLINIGLAILGLGVFYAGALAVNYYLNGNYLFFRTTDSRKIIRAMVEQVETVDSMFEGNTLPNPEIIVQSA